MDWFLRHLRKANETYFHHCKFALALGGKCFFAGLTAVIHAFFPEFFEHSTSKIVSELNNKLNHRNSDRQSNEKKAA